MNTTRDHDRALTFGDRLRQFRLRAGWSQEVLAEQAGLAADAISALERGVRRSPYPRTIGALARALGLSAEELQNLVEAPRGREPRRRPASGAAVTPAARTFVPRARLVVPLTPLVGRNAELADLLEMLNPTHSSVRLCTLVGPGGVGKTRLALALATSLGSAYEHGVTFVDLAPLHDHRLVSAAVARALDIRESGGRSAREMLVEVLQQREVLLVLDNFEHVLPAAALVTDVLQACPRVTVMITSRAGLRIRGERIFEVAPLTTPVSDADHNLDAVASSPAVQLFVQRAQALMSDFILQDSNAAILAAICRQVDGIPLALELAASRVRLLAPLELLQRLEHRLAVLSGGPIDLPERQRTLRSTLAWSHDLLGASEQFLFRRLAVFAGGCTLEAIEAVCTDANLPSPRILDSLQLLVENSLVSRTGGPETLPRFGMLETVHEYAEEKLIESGERAHLLGRYRDWCLSLVERIAPEWFDPEQVARLDRDQDNLRSCLQWTISTQDDDSAARLGVGCWPL